MRDSGPPTFWAPITPHATNPIAVGCRAIRVGATGGEIAVRMSGKEEDITLQVAAYETIVGLFTHVRATGTTAGTLHAGI